MLSDSQRAALTLRMRRGREGTGASKISRRPSGLTDLPLSYGQEQIWFLDQLAPGLPTYNVPVTLRLRGPLNTGALGRAVDQLTARHETLRTRLVAGADGRPVQVIDPPAVTPLEVTDLSPLEPDHRHARLREFIDTEAVRPFALAEEPLLRTWLLRLSGDEHMLLVVLHHAIFDGWSVAVFLRELTALYRQEAAAEPADLAELPVQFADYALWERQRLRGDALAGLESYWRKAMDGHQIVQFPADRPRPVVDDFRGGLAEHMTDTTLLDGLRELTQREGTTPPVTLMAGLQALLHRYTGQTDLVVGTVSANRTRNALAPLIGFLVNTLPIRCDLSGDPTFSELLARMQTAVTGAYAHQSLPFSKTVEMLRVPRDPGRTPLFQIMLAYAETDAAPVLAAGVEFTVTDLVPRTEAAKFDLDITVDARRGGLWFACSYKTALFDPATIRRLLGNFEVLLRGAIAHPSARLSELPVLTEAELHQELTAWNDTAVQVRPACVHQEFEAQVTRTPDAVAAEFEGGQASYAELNGRANQIARRLRDAGAGPEVLVGVCMQEGLGRLGALLAVWKAGGGYVPLDPALPPERLAFMVADAGIPVVVTDAAGGERLPADARITRVPLEAGWARSPEPGGPEPDATDLAGTGVVPANVAYVIYTSGSTGQPKGVVVEHRHAVNALRTMGDRWQIGPPDVVLQFAAFTFDVSVMNMFMPLLRGARLVLAPEQVLHSPPRLARLMRERRVSYADLPPAVLSLLAGEELPDLRVLITGGEELPSEVARHWVRPGLRFVNAYGPTETTVNATCQELDRDMIPPPIGGPVPNYQCYVLDPQLNPVPAGVIGELHVGGAGVARGYLNRPGLTSERFIADPFRPGPGARLYRTGDLVRRTADGTLMFAGRADDQVKIRGLRVELGEIEAALTGCPGIAQAVVTVVPGSAGDKQIIGYLRRWPGGQVSGTEVGQRVAERLPGYMVPGFLVFVDEFPLTSSGKIDKAALPAPRPQAGADHVAPATPIEAMVARMYAVLLGLEEVGATDSFFDLGGTSLTVMRLIRMMDDELDVDIGVAAVFLAPTPRQLAGLLRDKHGVEDGDIGADGVAARPRGDREASRITRRPAGAVHPPASSGQQQLWFLDRFAPSRATYNVPCPVRIGGPLDLAALGRAMEGLLARHETLRTRLVSGPDSRPVQVIDPPPAGDVELLDYSGGPDEAWRRLMSLADRELERPFDLAEGPLLRACLVRLAAEDHVLLITVHHAVFDGYSAGILVQDLAALYAAQVTGEPSGLAELPVQFADFAWWERQRLQGSDLAELETYWRGVMDGFETVQLPADRPRPAVDSFDGAEETLTLPDDLLTGLQELSRREGATLFVTLMTAFQALLHRYTGQSDLVVGTTSANRSRAALAPLIAFLVNTLPIRGDLSGDPPFTELLARVRDATIGAYAHQDLPFVKIVEALRVERDPSRAPVIQLMFHLVDAGEVTIPAAGATFGAAGKLSDVGTSKFDISLFAVHGGGELTITAVYATALFDPATIGRLLRNFEILLQGVVADPRRTLSRLPVLTEAELHRELAEWNDTAAGFPRVCLHEGFEAQAARTPDGVAAQYEGESISYAELNRQANQVARRLRAAGIGPEILAGVCMRASTRRLAALLGILKAGGGYVPLDPALPPERISFMMADAGLAVVLTDDSTQARLSQTQPVARVLSLDTEWPATSELDGSDLDEGGATAGNVAYVIYTSGSTGRPKGVVVEHRQAVNFAYGMIRHWHIGPADAVLQFASLSFDVSVMDMFVPLLAGGRIVLVPPQTVQSPPRLAELINAAGVTYACLTPSVLSLLAGYDFPGLRSLVSGGEELPSELVRAWLRPGLDFYNTYGPTEAAVVTTFTLLDGGTQLPPPIGRPLPNYQCYVLDGQLNPVPAGVTGELHIGGAGVARGYLDRPELTRERFIPDPFSPAAGARLYKSGDLVRRRPDGSIVFVGRADGQVKIRGLRIELGEIEAALLACEHIAQAVVTVVTDPAGEKQLAGYLRADPGTEPSPAELRAQLARTLPAYMIPAHLIVLAAFPLNPSGKIDRRALPVPGRGEAAAGHVAPATFLEKILADLYATVLNRDQVGATDGFFDIGGSSLQVMRLVDLISKELGVDVGVTTIFLHPAPRELAARIDAIRSGLSEPDESGPITELASGVGELPLFLIHAVGGTVFPYTQLARELGGAFRVYGVEAPGLAQDGATAGSLDELAADYTERILAAQPEGRYRLAGWSMGGVIAFEVARRLEQAGHQVAALVFLDAPFALPDTGTPAAPQLAAQFLADATHSLGWDATDLPDPDTTSAAGQLGWLTHRLSDGADTEVDARLQRRFDVFQAHHQMLAGYQPAGLAVRAPALLISADDSPNAPDMTRWPRVLSGPVTLQAVPGDHYSFLQSPLVTEVSTTMLKWHEWL